MKKIITDKLEKVVVSSRVTDTPAVLVTGQFGYSANMQKIMKSQAFSSGSAAMMGGKKILEINPRHPIINQLLLRVEADESDPEAMDLAWLLYDSALMSSGFDMEDTKDFSLRMYRLMKSGLKLNTLELLAEIEVPVAAATESAKDENIEL